jgi:hypothetical protein
MLVFCKNWFFYFVIFFAHPVFVVAELKPLDDADMSNVVGQAYISIDKHFNPDINDSTSYTRINFGMDVDIQANIETLELGRYERAGASSDTYGESKESDILIHNMGLGFIYDSDYYARNKDAARPLKDDGSYYTNGEIVPFEITDPFFEFAFDEATNEISGMRLGFGKAKGVLSGVIETLTGNVNIDIKDSGQGMRAASSSGTIGDQLVVLLTPLLEGSSPLATKAQLVDSLGNLDPVRATKIGVPDGAAFNLSGASGFTRWSLKNLLGWSLSSDIEIPNCSFFSCPSGDIYIYVNDCEVLGVQACFNLSNYNSFPIGKIQEVGGERYLTDSTEGMFLSFQTKDLDWLKDVKKSSPTDADFIRATAGAFFNVPNGAVTVNLSEAINGVEGVRREYIDRGNGLF